MAENKEQRTKGDRGCSLSAQRAPGSLFYQGCRRLSTSACASAGGGAVRMLTIYVTRKLTRTPKMPAATLVIPRMVKLGFQTFSSIYASVISSPEIIPATAPCPL